MGDSVGFKHKRTCYSTVRCASQLISDTFIWSVRVFDLGQDEHMLAELLRFLRELLLAPCLPPPTGREG